MTRGLIILLVTFALSLLMAPLAAEAPPARQTPARLGFISNSGPQLAAPLLEALRQGLRDLGWIEGQNVSIAYRWAEGQADRHPELAADLVRLEVDVILAAGSASLRAVQQATSRIPIVSAVISTDPVRLGLVASLAHPGGNLTGLASQEEEIVTKHVELLADVVPTRSRIGLLRHASTDPTVTRAAATVADKLGLTAQLLEVSEVSDFEGAFRAARADGAQALLVLPSPIFNHHRRELIARAARDRLPAVYECKPSVQDGGLMSYGPSLPEMYRRAATSVDKILNGTKPGELPIERPDTFAWALNLKTAQALGLTMPPPLLFQATEVIREACRHGVTVARMALCPPTSTASPWFSLRIF